MIFAQGPPHMNSNWIHTRERGPCGDIIFTCDNNNSLYTHKFKCIYKNVCM